MSLCASDAERCAHLQGGGAWVVGQTRKIASKAAERALPTLLFITVLAAAAKYVLEN